jgi:energy-coupling factor transporter ATP-binding protein EcfA2
MKLTNIKIERFKRLEKIDFDVKDVNILIGGNNSGKSTVIQAVHFAFTLFQSLTISKKWPAKTKKSTTVSPSDLVYIPSDDPYSLGWGGRLLEDEEKSIVVSFLFDTGDHVSVAVRKGRITNILVEPDNVDFAQSLSSLDSPYSVFSPGLAGVSRTENYVSDGVLLRVLARGDANLVLRNILYRLKKESEWTFFEEDLAGIFPDVSLVVNYDDKVDQYIDVNLDSSINLIPLDLAGTGFLQAVQILAYLHLFKPKLIILDEPDSHLHPNNQRLLCSLLTSIAEERNVQVLVTTHSRHVLDTMYRSAHLMWVQDGAVSVVSAEDQVDLLLELGALDIREKINAGKYKVIFLTEDAVSQYLRIITNNSNFRENETAILPYNGVTTTHLLKPLIKQIKELSNAHIFVHRDRDFLDPLEIEAWKKDIRALGAEPFVTKEIDIEGYFCSDDYIKTVLAGKNISLADVKSEIVAGEIDDITANYINGRVDHERKAGTIGKLDHGKLGAAAAKKVSADPLVYMKGKRKLSKLRQVLQEKYKLKFEIDRKALLPLDEELIESSKKYFKPVV